MFLATIKTITKVRYKRREIKDGAIYAKPEDFETVKAMWNASETAIVYRIAGSALSVLDDIPTDQIMAKTLAEELGLSTMTIRRVCEELSERVLINARKREREGRGRNA